MLTRQSDSGARTCLAILLATGWFALGPALCGAVNGADDTAGPRLRRDGNTVTILAGGRSVLEYRFTDVPFKPCVTRLFTPRGVQILRDSPHDHVHHHALMFALGVDGQNFWEEQPADKAGKELHQSLEDRPATISDGVATAGFSQRLDWIAPDDKTLLRERRTIEVHAAKDLDASLLTWRARLTPPEERPSVNLTGRYYFGLGMRFVESMDRAGRFFHADAARDELIREGEHVTRSKWTAYTAPVDGKPVTVALFDHPNNPRHPAGMFWKTQPFSYLSATLGVHKEPSKVIAGRPLELCYGVALWDGEAAGEQVEAMYRRWLKLAGRGVGEKE